ncbi:uncharacterized protein IUM83_09021 [Phytophthora cinnamomi]|uniref:uncharacterized protein n=1 Tax=Phytophthora cinnamomi TaxID=4785 RepID=UPI003559EADC|nr:hypothetical protein IUM83_09021 [Phytophthora cinnamomi]
MQKAAKIVIPVKKNNNDGDSDDDQGDKEISLAEAFQRRHPGFGRRAESYRDKLKRQRGRQQKPEQELKQQQNQHESESRPAATKRDSGATAEGARSRGATDPLPPEKQQILDRLARGSRAKISNREMKERSRRLYHQLPEVVERKRQEEVMRRRRERLNELREQEKERRLQQKQRRQQHQHR